MQGKAASGSDRYHDHAQTEKKRPSDCRSVEVECIFDCQAVFCSRRISCFLNGIKLSFFNFTARSSIDRRSSIDVAHGYLLVRPQFKVIRESGHKRSTLGSAFSWRIHDLCISI